MTAVTEILTLLRRGYARVREVTRGHARVREGTREQ